MERLAQKEGHNTTSRRHHHCYSISICVSTACDDDCLWRIGFFHLTRGRLHGEETEDGLDA